MKTALISVLIILSSQAFAIVGDSEEAVLQSNKSYCHQSGGKVVQLTADFSSLGGSEHGITKKFCQYQYGKQPNISIDTVGLDTLSTSPTIAATYVNELFMDPDRILPIMPYPNPSLNVCLALHGTEIAFSSMAGGFADKYGQSDICVFGDGSSISAWSLIYAATNQRLKVKAAVRSKSLHIEIPKVL